MLVITLLLSGLGHDDYATREWYHRRCDNLLFALISPDTHTDPEVRSRLNRIKRRQLSRFDLERPMLKLDTARWIKEYGLPGKSKILTDVQFFWLISDNSLLYQHVPGCNYGWFVRPTFPQDIENFCAHLEKLRKKP